MILAWLPPKPVTFCPWSGRITHFARPVRGFFDSTLIPRRGPPRCPVRRREHQSHTSFSSYAGRDFVEVLTKCRFQLLWRGDVRFVAGGAWLAFPVKRLANLTETLEDSIMSDVLPSIIVLAITAITVFPRELVAPRAKKGAPSGRRHKTQQDPAQRAKLQDAIAKAQRHGFTG